MNASLPTAFDLIDAARRSRAATDRREAREARESGLVTDSTTHTQGGEGVLVDTYANRLKRMRYNVIASANWINVDSQRGGFRTTPVFVTLTYRDIDQPEPSHIRDYLTRCRNWLKRRDVAMRYVWVAELQERGALHYHVIVWLPHGYKLPKPDKSGWWPHGWSNIKRAESPVGYLASYAGKLKTKAIAAGFHIPKGFRIYGVGGLDADDRQKRTWANLPGWLRNLTEPEHRCKRIVGGGFVSRETQEHWFSPFKIGRVFRAGVGALVSILPALPEGTELCHSSFTFRKS